MLLLSQAQFLISFLLIKRYLSSSYEGKSVVECFILFPFFVQVLATSTVRDASTNNNLEHDHLNNLDADSINVGEDDENMVSSSEGSPSVNPRRGKHLRYRTRVFAAEYVSLL